MWYKLKFVVSFLDRERQIQRKTQTETKRAGERVREGEREIKERGREKNKETQKKGCVCDHIRQQIEGERERQGRERQI